MKYFLILLLTLAILTPRLALAEENEPTAAPSNNQIPDSDEAMKRVQRIKDIVASKVAELNLVEKRGVVATVTETSNTEIKAIDMRGNTVNINVDELTDFNFEEEDFGISDLKPGVLYSFIGLYNKDTESLLARFISQPASIPSYMEGAIANIQEDDFQIKVLNREGETKIVDIETSTHTILIDENGKISKSGFSDLLLGQRVIVVGFDTDDKAISASRLIHFDGIPPTTEVLAKLQNETPTIASGSGNQLEILELEGKE